MKVITGHVRKKGNVKKGHAGIDKKFNKASLKINAQTEDNSTHSTTVLNVIKISNRNGRHKTNNGL